MKKYITLFLSVVCFQAVYGQQTGTFTDPRDNKVYKTVSIGSQTWLSENLAYKTPKGCWAFDNKKSNVSIYGYLYDWETAQLACPAGWHLPSDDEWSLLISNLGDVKQCGTVMKSESGWKFDANGTNTSGFNGLPAGSHTKQYSFSFLGAYAYWWSSTESDPDRAWYRSLYYLYSDVSRNNANKKKNAFSIRCVKD